MRNRLLFIGIIILALAAGVVLFLSARQSEVAKSTITIDGKTISVEVATTPESRQLGLSGRDSIADDEAMLFVLDHPGTAGIWMKDMNFAIDVIWLDTDKAVTHIETSVSPETYPRSFTSPVPSLYIIELAEGMVERLGVTLESVVGFGL